MDDQRSDADMTESVEMDGIPSGPQQASPIMKVPFRDGALPPAPRMTDGVGKSASSPAQLHSSMAVDPTHYPSPSEVWSGAVSRVQTQVHYNTSIIESQRRDVARISSAVDRLQQEMATVYALVQEVRAELRSRPAPPAHDRPDANELDILTTQLENVATKANEVDNLKMQIEIMRRRLRRLEGTSPPPRSETTPVPTAPPYVQQPEHPVYEQTPAVHPPHPPHAHFPGHHSTPLVDSRAISQHPPVPPPLVPSVETRQVSEHPSAPEPRPLLPGFRALDAHTSGMASWRPATGYVPPPAPILAEPTSQPREPEPQATGWAAVNVNPSIKRGHSIGEQPPHEASMPASPKRQKLAPLMPRTSYGESSTASSYGPTPEAPPMQPSRNPSNDSQTAAYSATPPSQPIQNIRFVPFSSGQEPPAEEPWRPEAQRMPSDHHHRGSPRRGRDGRGRGGRKSGHGGELEHGTPEADKTDWPSAGADGYYHTPGHGHDPNSSLVRRAGGHVGAPADRHHSDDAGVPGGTPAGGVGMYPDPHFMPTQTPEQLTPLQPSKKTRTKPVRNAEGILIRKDGRPDMRSVSSAMNLRKVHAKKEAERKEASEAADGGGGGAGSRTPADGEDGTGPSTPVASLQRGDSGDSNLSIEDGGLSAQERHRENMRKIFPYGIDGHSGPRGLAEQFFPKIEEARRPDVKIEAMVDGVRDGGREKNGDVEMDGVHEDGAADGERDGHGDRRMTADEHAVTDGGDGVGGQAIVDGI